MWRDDSKKLLKSIGYQDERDLKTFLPYLRENKFLDEPTPYPWNKEYTDVKFKCPVTKKFRVKIDYGVRKGSLGLVVGVAGRFTYKAKKGKPLTVRHCPRIHVDRVRVAFDDSGKTFWFDEELVSRTTQTKCKHIYVSAAEKKTANIMEPIDMLGAKIKVGSVVVWTWNMSVWGGSKPYTAFGTVKKINPKTVSIEAIFVRGMPKRTGKILRADINNVAVLDSKFMGRLIGEKLKI